MKFADLPEQTKDVIREVLGRKGQAARYKIKKIEVIAFLTAEILELKSQLKEGFTRSNPVTDDEIN